MVSPVWLPSIRLRSRSCCSTWGKAARSTPIRQIPGQGWVVWGARTLAAAGDEWRYVPVRRLCIQIETAIWRSVERFVFEANDSTTRARVRLMLEDYLLQKWQAGAVQGTRKEQASSSAAAWGKR